MKNPGHRIEEFITYLTGLEVQQNRAALADLRSGLRKAPGMEHRMDRHVVPFLGEWEHSSDRWFYLVGALFAWHPAYRRDCNLGASLRQIWTNSDSIESRFVALLNSHSNDLPVHLRQVIGLLRAAKTPVPVDWSQLLEDLMRWNDTDRRVQRRWARSFYREEDKQPITAPVGEEVLTGQSDKDQMGEDDED